MVSKIYTFWVELETGQVKTGFMQARSIKWALFKLKRRLPLWHRIEVEIFSGT